MESPERKPRIDPHKSSLINIKAENLKDIRKDFGSMHRIVEDPEGRRLYGGEHFRFGSDQMLLTRMLKGIVNVSDVVFVKDEKGEGKFYSYELPLEDSSPEYAERSTDLYNADAGVFMLTHIFHDGDHKWPMANTRAQYQRHAFFDFEHFGGFWRDFYAGRPEEIKKDLQGKDTYSKQILSTKIEELLRRFDGEEGLNFLQFIVSSIEKEGAGVPKSIQEAPGEDKVTAFQAELIKRIQKVKAQIEA